jgi:SNF2 family DNA or RNA helicase
MVNLYKFQEEDVEKLARQPSALIGSEMGTGKTHEAIALDEIWAEENKGKFRPTLVIAPLNTHDSWMEKYGEQAPQADVIRIDRKNRDRFVDDIRRGRGDVFLMHWDALRLLPYLPEVQFQTIIGDEVHRIANRKSLTTRAAYKLRAVHKLGMSGTAGGDRPDNLWSPLHWLYPTYFRSYWKFRKQFTEEDKQYRWDGERNEEVGYTKIVGVKDAHILKELMDPWYVRHLKREQCCEYHPSGVMPWLPEKVYDTIWVDLLPKQRRIYEQMRKEMVAWVNENEDQPLSAAIVAAQLQRLSQFALATPEIVGTKMVWRTKKIDGEDVRMQVEVPDVRLIEPSSKLDAAQELFLDHDNKQFLVGTSSKQLAYLAQQKFERKGISAFVLSGDTPQTQRNGMVDRFVKGDSQLFISVIQAGAEGIDGLQHATDTVVMLDRSWQTIKNQQFIDRLDRDGQKNTVQVIDIMARNTIDLGRFTHLETKWQWIREILGDSLKVQEREMVQKWQASHKPWQK